jgi:hypothetical protein
MNAARILRASWEAHFDEHDRRYAERRAAFGRPITIEEAREIDREVIAEMAA